MEVGATVSIKGLKGVIRYVGEYHEKPGIYVGIELEKPKGKNNGTIKGKQYFKCQDNYGLFIDIASANQACKIISPISPSKSTPNIDGKNVPPPPDSQISKSPSTPNYDGVKPSQSTPNINEQTPPLQLPKNTQSNQNQNAQSPRRTVVVQNAAPKLPDNLKSSISSSASNPNLNKTTKTSENPPQNIKLQSNINTRVSKSGDLPVNSPNQETKPSILKPPEQTSHAQAHRATVKPTPVKQLPQSNIQNQSKEYQESLSTPNPQNNKSKTTTVPSLNLKDDKPTSKEEANKSPRMATKQPAQPPKNSPRQTPTKQENVQQASSSKSTSVLPTLNLVEQNNKDMTTPNRQKPQEAQKPSNQKQNAPQSAREQTKTPTIEKKDQPNSARQQQSAPKTPQTPVNQQEQSNLVKQQQSVTKTPQTSVNQQEQSNLAKPQQSATKTPQTPVNQQEQSNLVKQQQSVTKTPQTPVNQQEQSNLIKPQQSATKTPQTPVNQQEQSNLIKPQQSVTKTPQTPVNQQEQSNLVKQQQSVSKTPQTPVNQQEQSNLVKPQQSVTKTPQTPVNQQEQSNLVKQQQSVSKTPQTSVNQQEQSNLTTPRIDLDSPRPILPDNSPLTNIDPQIQAQISELKDRLEKVQKNRAALKQQLIDAVNQYKQQRDHQAKKKKELEETLQTKLVESEIELETDMNDLESQILETAERTRHYLEMADEQRALRVIDLLEQINQEHELFERDIDLYVNAQRINVNQATQSVRILNDRLKKILLKKQKNDQIIRTKVETLNEKEQELAEKRPKWKVVTQLREKFSEIQEKVEHSKTVMMNKKAERTGIRKFYQIFREVPLLDSLYLVLCIQHKTSNNDVRHACELAKLVLSGFLTNSSKSYELFTALTEIDGCIEKGAAPSSVYGVIALLESMSSIHLDNSISIYSLQSSAAKISDPKLKKTVLDMSKEITGSPIIHPVLMDPSLRDDFVDFFTNFKYEIAKAEIGEEVNLDQFKGQITRFVVPEFDVLGGFIRYQLPHDDVQKGVINPEIQKKRQEREELEAKAILLKEMVEKEKEKYEQLKLQLVEPLEIYVKLEERIEELKNELNKYQI